VGFTLLDLYGNGNMENTEVDVVLGTIEDLFAVIIKIFMEKDEKKKVIILFKCLKYKQGTIIILPLMRCSAINAHF